MDFKLNNVVSMWKVREMVDKATNLVMNYTETESKVKNNQDCLNPKILINRRKFPKIFLNLKYFSRFVMLPMMTLGDLLVPKCKKSLHLLSPMNPSQKQWGCYGSDYCKTIEAIGEELIKVFCF